MVIALVNQNQEMEEATPQQTIKHFIDFLKADEKAKETIKAYQRVITHFNDEVNKQLYSISRRDLETYLAGWSEKKTSPSYMNFIRIVLKLFFKWLYGEDTYPTCVNWIKTKTIKREIDPNDILTDEEVKQLITAAESADHQATAARDRALISLLYETGGRIGELQKLNNGDVTFEKIGDPKPILTVKLTIPQRKTKGKKKGKNLRLVDSAEAIESWLKVHPNNKADQPMWVSLHKNRGGRIHVSTIRRILKRLAKQCGITKPVNPHNFRHSQVTASASYLADQELKKKFGWTAGSRMLQVYSHITDKEVEDKELQMRGIKKITDTKKRILTHIKCPRCGKVYSAGKRICKCGRPLDPDLAERWDQEKQELEDVQKAFWEEVQSTDLETLKKITELLKAAKRS